MGHGGIKGVVGDQEFKALISRHLFASRMGIFSTMVVLLTPPTPPNKYSPPSFLADWGLQRCGGDYAVGGTVVGLTREFFNSAPLSEFRV